MSNVYARFRKETQLQFMKNAWDLQFELTKYLMKDKNVPKKWRLIISIPLINKVDELVDNLNYANCIYPQSMQDYIKREKYQALAIANVWQLQNKLVKAIECIPTVKIENMTKIIELLEQTEAQIKKWKKADKDKCEKLFLKN